jgi:hypothetical protein
MVNISNICTYKQTERRASRQVSLPTFRDRWLVKSFVGSLSVAYSVRAEFKWVRTGWSARGFHKTEIESTDNFLYKTTRS